MTSPPALGWNSITLPGWRRAPPGLTPAHHNSLQRSKPAAARNPEIKIRYLHVNDLAVLGPAPHWPYALPEKTFTRMFGTNTPVLMAVPTRPGTVRALLAARGETSRFRVVGYREPARPTTPEGLLEHSGISAAALSAQAALMIKEHSG